VVLVAGDEVGDEHPLQMKIKVKNKEIVMKINFFMSNFSSFWDICNYVAMNELITLLNQLGTN